MMSSLLDVVFLFISPPAVGLAISSSVYVVCYACTSRTLYDLVVRSFFPLFVAKGHFYNMLQLCLLHQTCSADACSILNFGVPDENLWLGEMCSSIPRYPKIIWLFLWMMCRFAVMPSVLPQMLLLCQNPWTFWNLLWLAVTGMKKDCAGFLFFLVVDSEYTCNYLLKYVDALKTPYWKSPARGLIALVVNWLSRRLRFVCLVKFLSRPWWLYFCTSWSSIRFIIHSTTGFCTWWHQSHRKSKLHLSDSHRLFFFFLKYCLLIQPCAYQCCPPASDSTGNL